MTRLEIAQKVWQTFVIEGKPRGDDGQGACSYYSVNAPHGCAVGCLLSEQDRKSMPEGYVRRTGEVCDRLEELGFGQQIEFLEDLQWWHDRHFRDRDHLTSKIKEHLAPKDFATFEAWAERGGQ